MKARQASMIFFHADVAGLADAEAALRSGPLLVTASPGGLRIRWADGPVLDVSLEQGPHVTADARRVGRGNDFEEVLATCDARFAITFEDLDAVLDETNTLIETQLALQSITSGVMYNTWNNALSRQFGAP